MDACACDDNVTHNRVSVFSFSLAGELRNYRIIASHGACVLGYGAAKLVCHARIVDVENTWPAAVHDGTDLGYCCSEDSTCESKLLGGNHAVGLGFVQDFFQHRLESREAAELFLDEGFSSIE